MKVLLLGLGAQGKATLYDLLKNPDVAKVVVVERDVERAKEFISRFGDSRVRLLDIDANDKTQIISRMRQADIIIDLLPTPFRKTITEWAIEAGVNVVNTSFQSNIKEYENAAKLKGVIVMPEAGLDPGIDLILAGNAVKQFDEVHEFHSACGGVPVREACDNPLNYKVSWMFEGVLGAYKRPASIIVNGEKISISGDEIFDHSEEVDVPGVGKMDRYPNGFATTYARLLGIRDTVKNMGRYTLRWPGHSRFWKKVSALGLLDEEPVGGISPRKYLAKLLEPRLQYKDDEKDMIVLRNEISGIKDGKLKKMVQQVIDYRDLDTGFMAMNRTVGFTASIIAQMILEGKIKGTGMLNPGVDVPYDEFLKELTKRGVTVEETVE